MGSTERRLGVYLRSFPQAVTLLFHGLIHGSFMILSPQTGFRPPIFSCFAAVRFPQSRETTFVQTPTISWTSRLAVPPPSFPSW